MTAPLTDDEARRVTECPDCEHPWDAHYGDGCGYSLGFIGDDDEALCPCTRADETLPQVAALVAEREAAVLEQAAAAIERRRLVRRARWLQSLRWPAQDEKRWSQGMWHATAIVHRLARERAR